MPNRRDGGVGAGAPPARLADFIKKNWKSVKNKIFREQKLHFYDGSATRDCGKSTQNDELRRFLNFQLISRSVIDFPEPFSIAPLN